MDNDEDLNNIEIELNEDIIEIIKNSSNPELNSIIRDYTSDIL